MERRSPYISTPLQSPSGECTSRVTIVYWTIWEAEENAEGLTFFILVHVPVDLDIHIIFITAETQVIYCFAHNQ